MTFTIREREGLSLCEEQELFNCVPVFLTCTGVHPSNPVLEEEKASSLHLQVLRAAVYLP